MRKGKFEGMKRHLRLQNRYTMIVETKWIRIKTVQLDFVKNYSRLVQLMCPLAAPWISTHIVVMQSRRKKLYKRCFLTGFQEHRYSSNTMAGFTQRHSVVPDKITSGTVLQIQTGTQNPLQVCP